MLSLELLLDHGADIHVRTVNGATPLHYFVRCDYGSEKRKYYALMRKVPMMHLAFIDDLTLTVTSCFQSVYKYGS